MIKTTAIESPIRSDSDTVILQHSKYQSNKKVRLCLLETKPDFFRFSALSLKLLADTKLFLGDDSAVAGDILLDQIIKEATTLTYECL